MKSKTLTGLTTFLVMALISAATLISAAQLVAERRIDATDSKDKKDKDKDKAKDKARDNVERMVAATKRLEALLADPGPGIIVRRLPPAQNDDTPPLTAAPPFSSIAPK